MQRFIAGLYVMLYAGLRFAIETLRGDQRATTFLALSIGQTIAVGTFLLGALVVTFVLWRGKGRALPRA